VVGLIALGLTGVPLLGSLGYENAFVLAPILSILGVAVGVDVIRSGRDRPGHLLDLVQSALGQLVALHGVVLLVLLLGRLWQPGCDPVGGLLFYVIGPLFSSIIGCCCGIWAGVIFDRRSAQIAAGLLPMVACVGIELWRLYAHPVVFAYDPFWGYFSGSIYDEAISVGRRYWRYRAYNGLAVATAMLAWSLRVDPVSLRSRRPPLSLWTGAALALVVGGTLGVLHIFAHAPEYGFTATAASISRELSATHETEHFVIHYAPRSADARRIEDMGLDHEFAWAELHKEMGRAPATKVHSFLFTGPTQKRSLMGAGTVQVAAPWRRQIYLDDRGFPHPILRHELAHVFAAEIGDPWFGVARRGLKINMGLVEGLATALAPRASDRLDLHDQAVVLDRLGRLPRIDGMMGPGFFASASRVAYAAAGSFCRWLIDTRGFERMAILYRTGGDFTAAYGEPLPELEAAWIEYLRSYPGVREADVESQAQRFNRKSVFARPCAHRVAEVEDAIGDSTSAGRFDESVQHRRALCALEPHEVSHRLGLARGLVLAERYDDARAVLDDIADDPELTASLRAELAEIRGDLAIVLPDLPAAMEAYDRGLLEPLSAGERRVLELKRAGAKDPALAPLIVDYFSLFDRTGDWQTQGVRRMYAVLQMGRIERGDSLAHYLAGRQLVGVQATDAAHDELMQSLSGTTPLPSVEFEREAVTLLLATSLQLRRYDDARSMLARLEALPDLGNGNRLELREWAARIDFFAAERPDAAAGVNVLSPHRG